MSKYRKKPVVIDAFQLNERGLVGEDWFWDAVSENTIITHDFGKFHPGAAWCEIKTLEGTMVAKAGDYIIRGVNGEIYPCKRDIFDKTYEAVQKGRLKNNSRKLEFQEIKIEDLVEIHRVFSLFFIRENCMLYYEEKDKQ